MWEKKHGKASISDTDATYLIYALTNPQTWFDGLTETERQHAIFSNELFRNRDKFKDGTAVLLEDANGNQELIYASKNEMQHLVREARQKRPDLRRIKPPIPESPAEKASWEAPLSLRYFGSYFARAPAECVSFLAWAIESARKLAEEKTLQAQLTVQTVNFESLQARRHWTAKDVEAKMAQRGDNSAVVEKAIRIERRRISDYKARRKSE